MPTRFLFTLLLSPLFFYGQDTQKLFGNRKIDITPYISVGAHYVNTPNLEERLSALHYDLPTTILMSSSAGIKLGGNKFQYGVEFTGTIPFKRSAFFTQGQLFLCYKVISSKSFSLAPEAGIGIQKMTRFLKAANSSNNFDSLVLHSGNYLRLNNKNTVLNIAATFCFKKMSNSKKFYLHPLSIIKLGYTRSLSKKTWKSDNMQLLNSPVENTSTLYIQLLIGSFL